MRGSRLQWSMETRTVADEMKSRVYLHASTVATLVTTVRECLPGTFKVPLNTEPRGPREMTCPSTRYSLAISLPQPANSSINLPFTWSMWQRSPKSPVTGVAWLPVAVVGFRGNTSSNSLIGEYTDAFFRPLGLERQYHRTTNAKSARAHTHATDDATCGSKCISLCLKATCDEGYLAPCKWQMHQSNQAVVTW